MSRTSRNTLITLFGNLLATVLGMAVVVCVSARYGAGHQMDAFWTANTLPNVLGQIFLSVSLLILSPLFVQRKTQLGDAAAWRLGNTFLTGAIVVAVCLCCLLFFGAPWVTRLLAPGLDAGTARNAARLLRVLSVSVVGLTVSGAGAALLISHHRFAVASLVRPVSQLCVLAGLLTLSADRGVLAYAYSVVVGSLVACVMVVWALLGYRHDIRPAWSRKDPATAALLAAVPMVLLARIVDHGSQIVSRAIGSTLPVGSISALGYAWAIFQVPGILGASLGTVVFPQFSEKIASGRHEELVGQVVRCVRIMLFVSAPLSVGLICLSTPLIQLLLERGVFRHSDTILVARVLACFGIGVLVTSVNALIGNLYWSLRLIRSRVVMEAAAIALCLGSGLWLANRFGAPGLALSSSLMYLLLTVTGIGFLAWKILPSGGWMRVVHGALGACASAAGMAVAIRLWIRALPVSDNPALILASGGVVGLGAYLLLSWALQREEMVNLGRSLLSARRGAVPGARQPQPGSMELSGENLRKAEP